MTSATVVRIQTPEGISFGLPLAGPLSRAAALFIDFLLTGAAASVVGKLFAAVRLVSNDGAVALGVLSYFVLTVGYGLALEWFWRGQTVGKRLMRLRVMDAAGLRLRFHQIAIRNVLRVVDALPFLYLVGGVSSLLTQLHQRLGDLAGNTIVVQVPSAALPSQRPAARSHYNSLLAHNAPLSRLRSQASPEAMALAREALERRDQFDPLARVLVFQELATHFREMARFPEEATAPLSDEQYVRNVVEVVVGGAMRGDMV